VCGEANGVNVESALILRVELPNGGAADGAKIEVRAFVNGGLQRIAQDKTDRNGLFHVCNPPRHVQLTIRIDHDQAQSEFFTTEDENQLKVEKLQLKPRR
jgi:hypothetical protein